MTFQPAIPTPPAAPQAPVAAQAPATPSAILKALQAQRSELRNQMDRLEGQRREISDQLNNGEVAAEAKAGLVARLKDIDARIAATDQELAQSNNAVAKATAVPGAYVEQRPPERSGPPDDVFVVVPVVFTIFVLAPIAIAYARRLWRRGATVVSPVPQDVKDRLNQLGESVESIALEVERIGEGQRFLTKVMSENGRALGAGPAQPLAVPKVGEQVAVRREG
jgi:hypothetical protein